MDAVAFGTAISDSKRVLNNAMRGAITTGITPEPSGQSAPATPIALTGAPHARGSLFTRVLRFPAKSGARPKTAGLSS